jgi:hypothetical protein
MQDYIIDVTRIEELQMVTDKDSLDSIFSKAKSTIVNGAEVILQRTAPDGNKLRFDQMSTLEDLDRYRREVYKYL